jgi:hypothetical protein
MFYEFAHRHTPCTIEGANENVILSRDTKGSSVVAKEYMFIGRFSPSSIVQNGSLVVTDVSFLVQTLRITPDADKYCSMVKTNALIAVQRYGQPSVGDPDFLPIVSGVVAYAEFVTADFRQQHIGLLATTDYVLVLQKSVDIKSPDNPTLFQSDRVILNGRKYQVDVVDDLKLPNLYHVQLSAINNDN